ncbi:MAG: bifunctional YncE family protein/alkaline phosphatase family protein [Acidobacteriota bacterium]
MVATFAVFAVFLAVGINARGGSDKMGKRQVTDPGVITTRQAITPAGVQSVFSGKVFGLSFLGGPDELAVATVDLGVGTVTRVDWRRNVLKEVLPLNGNPGLQGLVYDPVSKRLLLSGTRLGDPPPEPPSPVKTFGNPSAAARLMEITGGQVSILADRLGTYSAGSPGIAATGDRKGRRLLALPLIHDNKLVLFDLNKDILVGSVGVPVAPFAAVITDDGAFAYVTNWGGRLPQTGDQTAPLGTLPGADRVVIDSRGVLASGTVTKVNLETQKVEKVLNLGLHPTALAIARGSGRLYVANTNEDTISVIDSRTDAVTATWRLQPFEGVAYGLAPTALLVSPDGGSLFVACGGINAVLLLDAANGKVRGMMPTAWYPNGLAISPDGKYLAVSTLLGVGSGSKDKPEVRWVHAIRGTVHVIPLPDEAQLANYTLAVAENNHLARLSRGTSPTGAARSASARAIPLRPGEPSFIEHVVYIIKENRSYDQLFGDLEKGNGEPSLVMFGAGIADNHRKLAREFVLLDNFYASGGNSGDGHQWATQANETSYVLWPAYQGRSYPFDGTDPIAYSAGGFIWDAALRQRKTVAVYGEFAPRQNSPFPSERKELLQQWKQGKDFYGRWNPEPQLPNLKKVFSTQFPSYSIAIPDVIRADIFLKDLHAWTDRGTMPNLVILQLPSDHSYGTRAGVSTPEAMVADNDLALGRIVEALSHSPFWKKMAIFVVEDDAALGVDHVDGHRTVALAVSPYVRREAVDSTFYAHQSILKTIELILGLEPMTIFDRIANDMRQSFVDQPDYSSYTAVTPTQDLYELNPETSLLHGPAQEAALACEQMRWDVPDAVPSRLLNQILWHHVKGWNSEFPGVRRSVFAPLSLDIDDEAISPED